MGTFGGISRCTKGRSAAPNRPYGTARLLRAAERENHLIDSYADIVDRLRATYDEHAQARDQSAKQGWKLRERETFLRRVRVANGTRLLEIGAGTGQDAAYFRDAGLDVVATDLSPGHVERCRAKGLDARKVDFLGLIDEFGADAFDACYALNCLLHVPNVALPGVLTALRAVLRPGGLLYVATYGGHDVEGFPDWDWHRPARFFSLRTPETMRHLIEETFHVVDFRVFDEEEYPVQVVTATTNTAAESPRP